jgi:hypothetical protein
MVIQKVLKWAQNNVQEKSYRQNIMQFLQNWTFSDFYTFSVCFLPTTLFRKVFEPSSKFLGLLTPHTNLDGKMFWVI